MNDFSHAEGRPVATLAEGERVAFLRRTYSHLFGAVVLFTLIELVLFRIGVAQRISETVMRGPMTWLLVLGGFMVVGWLASSTAMRATSPAAQYAALFGYVAAEALLFVPLLYMAGRYAPGAIESAALVTLLAFTGLTATVLLTRKDFSFLGSILRWAAILALVAIVAATAFGFTMGTLFSVVMVAFAGAAVLYDTSNILHRYPADRHVAGALALFASIALMFWYVLRIVLAARE